MMRILTFALLLLCLNSTIFDIVTPSSQLSKVGNKNLKTAGDTLVVSEQEQYADWRTAITSELIYLPNIGYPGQAIVFGNNASVIIVGDKINDVLIAAGQVGKGRVVVATHPGYAENFTTGDNWNQPVATLQNNIKEWATKGANISSSNVMEAASFLKQTDKTLLKLVKMLYFTQDVFQQWTEKNKTKILNFVKNGGALFVATTPSSWSKLKKSNNFNLMLTYKTLLQAGIAFNGKVIQDSTTFYLNKPTYLSHLSVQVNIALSPENDSFNYTETIRVIEQAQFLNNEILAKFQQRIKTYLTSEKIYSIAPSQEALTTSTYKKAQLLCYQFFFLNGNFKIAAPKYENFPGSVDKSAPNFKYIAREFTLNAPGFQQYHHTGLYAVAGQSITVEVLGALPNATWTVYIGFHYDNDADHQSWVRWPKIFTKTDLKKRITFSCGFGGLIVLESPFGTNQTIKIRASHAVEAPWYDSQNTTSIRDWQRRKNAPGAWGCVEGKWVGFCMPRASFENVDPLPILNAYDRIYVEYHALRGTKPQNERKRYIIADLDPSAGYMHAGYPIVTQMDVANPSNSQFQFNYTTFLTQGHWGLFHEMGHNMQRSWWTPSGTEEVTVNIFSLKATQIILGKTPKNAPWLIDQKPEALKYLLNLDYYNTWKSYPGIALFVYAQVIEDYGWDSMRNLLASSEIDHSTLLSTEYEQGIIDYFWSKYSLEVQVDLSDLLKKWAIPFTSDFTSKVAGLPPYVQKVDLFAP